MVKIEEIEIEIEDDGLLLLIHKRQRISPTEIGSAVFGVFEKIDERSNKAPDVYVKINYSFGSWKYFI